jgi:hypothetical protein
VGAIFDSKKGKHVDDVPAEGNKSKSLNRNTSGARKARSLAVMRAQGRDDDEDEALAVDRPARALERLPEALAFSTTC